MNFFAIKHIQFVTYKQNKYSNKYKSDIVHQICKEVSDRSWNRFVKVFKLQVMGNIGSIDNVKSIIVERFNFFRELPRLEVRKDLSGIPNP